MSVWVVNSLSINPPRFLSGLTGISVVKSNRLVMLRSINIIWLMMMMIMMMVFARSSGDCVLRKKFFSRDGKEAVETMCLFKWAE